MKQTKEMAFVENLMHPAVTCKEDEGIEAIAQRIIRQSVNHIVVADDQGKLRGIVTSWDITKAIAEEKRRLKDIIVRRVVTTSPNETVETASRKMAQHRISALPVINHERKVLGIITSEDTSRLVRG